MTAAHPDKPAPVQRQARICAWGPCETPRPLARWTHAPTLGVHNQLIPQLLQIRVHADHSSQSLHLSRPLPPT